MVKHIIFDCFGTLIDTGNNSIKAVEKILSNVGATTNAEVFYKTWKTKKRQIMDGPEFFNEKTMFVMSLAETFKEYGITADPSKEAKPMIDSLFAERHAFPEVKEALSRLTMKNIDFAVGSTTDTDSLLYYLEANHLSFSHIYTSENMQVYKPHEKFYQTILQRSGWQTEDCLFVGDSYSDDVCGPKKVGMKAVLIDRKSRYQDANLLPKPDYIIHSLLELADII